MIQALQLMGLRNTVEIVTGLLLRQAFPVGDNAAMETFWQTSSGIAELTAQLARPLGIKNRDEAYTFALFRDYGVPLMIRQFPTYANFMLVALALAAEWIYTRHNVGSKCREWSQGGDGALKVLGISEAELLISAEKIDH